MKGRTLAVLLDERSQPERDFGRYLCTSSRFARPLLMPTCAGRPPRPQTVEHHGGCFRRGAGGRLGPGEGAPARRRERSEYERGLVSRRPSSDDHSHDRRGRPFAVGGRHRHAVLHEPGTGARRDRGVGRAGGRLLPGSDPLRDPDRPAALSRQSFTDPRRRGGRQSR